MRRPVRKGQGQQVNDTYDADAKIPIYEKIRRMVHDKLHESGSEGCTAGDLYKSLDIDARRIREALQSLSGRDAVTGEKCRCGCATIYKLREFVE